jgi:hypothetical protein
VDAESIGGEGYPLPAFLYRKGRGAMGRIIHSIQITIAGLLIVVLGCPLGSDPVGAEMVKNLSIGTILDSNAFGSHQEESDLIGRINLYLANRMTGTRSQLEYYFSGTGNVFTRAGDRAFSLGTAGVAYARKVGEQRSMVNASAGISVRLDRPYYDIYDYVSTQASVSGKVYPSSGVMLRGSYRVKHRNYWNLDLFNHTEHRLTGEVSRFLPSRTTLKADLCFGYKDNRNAVTETYTTGGWFGRGGGRETSYVVEPGVSNEAQLVYGLQIAQSVAAGTGLSLRYQIQASLKSGGTYLTGEETTYSGEDDLFNDRYDYKGHEWTFRLTQQLPRKSKLVASAGYEIRDFAGRQPLDLEGNPIEIAGFRRDKSAFGSLSLEKPLAANLNLGIWYGLDRNKSNDPYYAYGLRHSLSMDLKLSF